MNMQNNMSWIPFYTSFADKLLNYKSDRNTLLTKLQNVFKTVGMKFPKLEEDDSVIDIDPFTVYGFFNKGITHENRKIIIKALISEFNINAPVPDDFDGIPLMSNLKAVFFGWDRNDDDINNLWELFGTALKLSADDSDMNRKGFIDLYNKVRTQNCIRWNITMALYWIRPYTFINLDSRNRNYMKDKNNISKDIVAEISEMKNVPSGEKYLEICKKCSDICKSSTYKYNNFPELSNCAWVDAKSEEHHSNWIPSEDEYEPNLSAEDWNELLKDESVFDKKSLCVIKQFCVNDGKATCSELAERYGKSYSYYSKICSDLAQRVHKKTNCALNYRDNCHVRWWAVLFVGKEAEEDQAGMWVWKLRWELREAILKTDVSIFSPNTLYSKDFFLSDVFITETEYDKLKALVLRKKNVILQGAPGVGKTYSAKRLAYSIIGEINENRICMVQFHQNYSYEDFIIGYRPNDGGGFELRSGIFYNFCERCKENPEEPYFFIIDEINRGNLSKIFGELLMLIETDKRGKEHTINLAYGGRPFYTPENLHIIGMMNTADRSLAMIDYALRRRFSFFTMRPAFENSENNGFDDFIGRIDCPLYHSIIGEIKNLNNVIRNDSALGKGFEIGHSYFSPEDTSVIDDEWVRSTVEYEIIPLIEEYWFDDEEKAGEQKKNLYRALGEEYDGR